MTEKEFKDLEKEFCDYETSVALKELGFREKCPTYYDMEDNVGLLLNTQWTSDCMPCQFIDCLESHNSNTSDDVHLVEWFYLKRFYLLQRAILRIGYTSRGIQRFPLLPYRYL